MQKLHGHVTGEAKDTSLEDATFRLPDGREKKVAIVHRPAAVAIVPVRTRTGTVEPEVLLVRQPRPAVDEPALVEIVAGKIDAGEDPLTTAKRELAEEAGLQAQIWTPLAGDLLPAPGYLREPIHLFAARALTTVSSREEDSHITGEWVLLRDAVEQVLRGEIRDMKAMLGLLMVDKLHQKQLMVDEQLAEPLEELDLSVRAYNCLKRERLNRVGEILPLSDATLLGLRGFEQKQLDELDRALSKRGLHRTK